MEGTGKGKFKSQASSRSRDNSLPSTAAFSLTTSVLDICNREKGAQQAGGSSGAESWQHDAQRQGDRSGGGPSSFCSMITQENVLLEAEIASSRPMVAFSGKISTPRTARSVVKRLPDQGVRSLTLPHLGRVANWADKPKKQWRALGAQI